MGACAMQTVVKAHVAKGENKQALEVSKEALAVFREVGDKKLEADMLLEVSNLHSAMGNFNEATKAVDEAIPLYVDLGDEIGKASATEMVGAVEDGRAAMESEAERKKSVKEKVAKLKESLQNRDGDSFKEVMDSLYSDENVTMEDVEGVIEDFMKKDPDGTLEFMRENHPENWALEDESELNPGKTTHSSGGVYAADGERIFKEGWQYDRRFFYFMFRLNMMGYGPGLRTLKTAFRQGRMDNVSSGGLPFGVSTMMLKDDHDDWEETTGWHPGLHDCALQTGSCRGYPLAWRDQMTRIGETGNFHYHPDNRSTAT